MSFFLRSRRGDASWRLKVYGKVSWRCVRSSLNCTPFCEVWVACHLQELNGCFVLCFCLFCPWLYCVNIKLLLKCIIDCSLLVYPVHNLGRDSKKDSGVSFPFDSVVLKHLSWGTLVCVVYSKWFGLALHICSVDSYLKTTKNKKKNKKLCFSSVMPLEQ